jgi:hypothetical protein
VSDRLGVVKVSRHRNGAKDGGNRELVDLARGVSVKLEEGNFYCVLTTR